MWKDAQAHAQQARDELEVIFDESLATLDLKAATVAMPSPASPPESDPQNDEMVEITPTAATVTIVIRHNTGLRGMFRYGLGLHEGRSMIEKKDVFRRSENKWRRYHP
ncbi:MAG: NTF2 fold immunity protein [Janthinobacterium lividum]